MLTTDDNKLVSRRTRETFTGDLINDAEGSRPISYYEPVSATCICDTAIMKIG